MMGKLTTAISALLALTGAAGASAQQPTSVTLFNSGRVLVRRSLAVSVPNGTSTQALDLGMFSPTTFTTLEPGVTVYGIRFDPAWSEEALLRRNVGKHFEFSRPIASNPALTASATLLALDPERWKWDSTERVVFSRPGQIQWPAALVPTSPLADVTLHSDRSRQGLKVMYETSGASWNASYRIFLGAQGRIEGVAALSGGTLDLPDAEVQLLAGDIGQAPAPEVMMKAMAAPRASRMDANASYIDGVPQVGSVGEAHVYTLPARLTFIPGLEFTAALFEPIPVRGERRYTLPGALQFYGGFQQQPDETPVPVAVSYHFDRKTGTSFGDLVLPGGVVSLYDNDNAGRVQLIGQGFIGHTPAGKELTVETGSAFDVTARRVQTEFGTTRATVAPYSTVAMVAYRVTLQNAKDSAAVVEVREDRGGEWSVVSSSVPAQRRSSSRYVFPVTVPAKGTTVLTYRVRVVW